MFSVESGRLYTHDLLHRRWPVTERCLKCGTVTPRDRDACLNCNEPFPLPALRGIEMYA